MSKPREPENPSKKTPLGKIFISIPGSGLQDPGLSLTMAEIIRQKADAGDAEAQFTYGNMLIEGVQLPADNAEARDWYLKAANQGHARAMFNLGVIYEKGMGVRANAAEGLAWYQKAAAEGDEKAYYNLGVCYLEGRGTAKHGGKANDNWLESALRGFSPAQSRLALSLSRGDGGQTDLEMAYILASLSKESSPDSRKLLDILDKKIPENLRSELTKEAAALGAKISQIRPNDKRRLREAMAGPDPNAWFILCRDLNRELGKISGHDRSDRWLEVWAQLGDGTGIQTSTSLSSWPKLGAQLAAAGCSHGLVAVRQKSATPAANPGVTLVISDPMGGSMTAREAMAIFARHGLGGALAYSEPSRGQAVLKFIFSPHWYAKSGDTTFGVNWGGYDSSGGSAGEAKLAWCQGAEKALREVLKSIPSLFIYALCFDNYACNDRLDTLSGSQLQALAKIPPGDLEAALLK